MEDIHYKRRRQICTKIANLLWNFSTKETTKDRAVRDVTRLYNTLHKFFETKDYNGGLGVYLWSQTMGRDLRMVRVYYTNDKYWHILLKDKEENELDFLQYNRIYEDSESYQSQLVDINNIDKSLNDIPDNFKFITFIIANNDNSWNLVKTIFTSICTQAPEFSSNYTYNRISKIIQYYERNK